MKAVRECRRASPLERVLKVTGLTAPVHDAYFALCSTNLTGNLDNIAGFVQKNQYPAPMNALRSEWGAAGRMFAGLKFSLIDLELPMGQQGASVIAA